MMNDKLRFEINMEDFTEAQKADVLLFQKTFLDCTLFSFKRKPEVRFSILEGMEIIAIASYNCPGKDYLEEENDYYIPEISKEQMERIKPFMNKIISIRKAKNKPFVVELRSGLFLWVAPKLCSEPKKETKEAI